MTHEELVQWAYQRWIECSYTNCMLDAMFERYKNHILQLHDNNFAIHSAIEYVADHFLLFIADGNMRYIWERVSGTDALLLIDGITRHYIFHKVNKLIVTLPTPRPVTTINYGADPF